MSSPTSVKLTPPNYLDPRIRRPYIWVYIAQIWLSLLIPAFLVYWAFYPWATKILPVSLPISPWALPNLVRTFWDYPYWFALIMLPLIFMCIYVAAIVSTASVTKISLWILNKMHPATQGVFYRSRKDQDYLFFNLRNLSRVLLFWLVYSGPNMLFKKYFIYTFFKIPIGKKSIISHAWISPEFIKIGENVIIGQSACLYSYHIQGDKLLVAEIVIEDGVQLGPQVVILPGTHVGHNSIIDGGSFTHPFAQLEANSVFHGCPAKNIGENLHIPPEL